MRNVLMRYATPLITGLFLVSLISGVALFFHVGSSWFHGMHEWLSTVLIVPFLLHIWKNWRAFICYFRRIPMAVSLAVSVLAAALFVYPAGSEQGERRGPPQFAITNSVLAASPSAVADVFGTAPDELVSRLKAAGFKAASVDKSLKDIASSSGKRASELYPVLTGSR